jgi:hypothetical protein
MATGLETPLVRAVGRALSWLVADARRAKAIADLEDQARPPVATAVAAAAFDELSADETTSVATYLASPDFEHLALQLLIGQLQRPGRETEVRTEVREQLRQSVRLHGLVAPQRNLSSFFGHRVVSCSVVGWGRWVG